MAVEPSEEERAALVTLRAVADWASLRGVGSEAETPRGAFFALLGASDDTLPRLVALVPETAMEGLIEAWVSGVSSPTLIDQASARLVARTCRLLSRLGLSLEQQRRAAAAASSAAAAVTPASGVAARKVKLSLILSQADDSEAVVLGEAELRAGFARYEALFGLGVRPSPDAEPTHEQLSALHHLVSTRQNPYADFAVWGPHGMRLYKRMKLAGQVFRADGSIHAIEVLGPPNFDAWLGCYAVLATAYSMLDIVDLGNLERYKEMMTRYHSRYGPGAWLLLYQADVRARSEHVQRTMLVLSTRHDAARSAGGTTAYDPARPWNFTWASVVDDSHWWRRELEEPALLYLTRSRELGQLVTGEAPTASSGTSRAPPAKHAAQPRESSGSGQPAARGRTRSARVHNVESGLYLTNRRGSQLCAAFQQGTCGTSLVGEICPTDRSKVHQCSRCLATSHGLSSCPHAEMPKSAQQRQQGKSRGRGKGSGGYSGKPQR